MKYYIFPQFYYSGSGEWIQFFTVDHRGSPPKSWKDIINDIQYLHVWAYTYIAYIKPNCPIRTKCTYSIHGMWAITTDHRATTWINKKAHQLVWLCETQRHSRIIFSRSTGSSRWRHFRFKSETLDVYLQANSIGHLSWRCFSMEVRAGLWRLIWKGESRPWKTNATEGCIKRTNTFGSRSV